MAPSSWDDAQMQEAIRRSLQETSTSRPRPANAPPSLNNRPSSTAARSPSSLLPPPSITCCFCKRHISPGSPYRSFPQNGWAAFHPECFKCSSPCCQRVIDGPFCTNKEGRPYHQPCFQELFCVRCCGCSQYLEGQYMVVDGKPMHKHCFKCAMCNNPIVGSYLKDSRGRAVCQGCYAASLAPKCTACGAAIPPGKYAVIEGKQYHNECVRCGGCNKLVEGRMQIKDGLIYHPECHTQLFHPRCYVCTHLIPSQRSPEGALATRYLQEPEFPEYKACPAHQHDGTPQCTGCHRFIPRAFAAPFKDSSGRHTLCEECTSIIVPDTEGARPLYDEIVRFFQGKMGLQFPYVPPVMLVDWSALNQAARQGGSLERKQHVEGLCLTEVNVVVETVSRFALRVPQQLKRVGSFRVTAILGLYGLPRPRLAAVLAHELMHCWLAVAGFKQRAVGSLGASDAGWGLSMDVEEGLCELMSWLYLDTEARLQPTSPSNQHNNRLVGAHCRRMLERTDAVYGDGFRQAHRAYCVLGLPVLLEHVKETGTLPVV